RFNNIRNSGRREETRQGPVCFVEEVRPWRQTFAWRAARPKGARQPARRAPVKTRNAGGKATPGAGTNPPTPPTPKTHGAQVEQTRTGRRNQKIPIDASPRSRRSAPAG